MTVDAGDVPAEVGGHVVQFYDHEADLFATVGRYLADAIDAGQLAIAVTTEPHRRALERKLLASGIDLTTARRGGQVVLLDAALMLASITTDGQVDREAFHSVIGGLLREATATGHPVRVYGEMVALLWDAGDVLAAIELESLWNDLGESLRFSLFCSYEAASVSGSGNADARQRLCHLHSHVIEPSTDGGVTVPTLTENEVMAQFAAEISAPRAVRHFVIDTLRQRRFPDELIDDAALVSSELAANAVLHATSAFSVALRFTGPLVRLEVRDCRCVRESTLTTRRERGLGVVTSLALRWGVDAAPGGKIVWAEFGAAEAVGDQNGAARSGTT